MMSLRCMFGHRWAYPEGHRHGPRFCFRCRRRERWSNIICDWMHDGRQPIPYNPNRQPYRRGAAL